MIKIHSDYNEYMVCINPKESIWQVIIHRGTPDKDGLCDCVIKELIGKPTIPEIVHEIHQYIESEIDKKIEFGFVFKGTPVHLNKENEDNFFKTFVFASLEKQSGQNFGVFPCPFKLGTPDTPEIHIFKTFEELSEFCLGAFLFKKNCIMEGFLEKQKIDMSVYYPYFSEEELSAQGIKIEKEKSSESSAEQSELEYTDSEDSSDPSKPKRGRKKKEQSNNEQES